MKDECIDASTTHQCLAFSRLKSFKANELIVLVSVNPFLPFATGRKWNQIVNRWFTSLWRVWFNSLHWNVDLLRHTICAQVNTNNMLVM